MEEVMDILDTPESQIDVERLTNTLSEIKDELKNAEADIKDGKRRVSGAKGPKKRNAAKAADAQQDGSDDDADELDELANLGM